MKKGFSLIELMVAILIASLIALSLFQLLSQTRKGVRFITNVIDVDLPLIAFYNQVQKDITGMFTPNSSLQVFAEREQQQKRMNGQKNGQDDKKKAEQAKITSEKNRTQPIKNVFVLEAPKDSFFCSFITTGGIQMLETDGTLTPSPYVRRVAYLLEKDPQRPEVFRLMYRMSDRKLDVDFIKSAEFTPSYELMSGIRRFEIELVLIEVVEKKVEEKKGAPQKQPEKAPKQTVATVKEWNEEEIWNKYKTLIPAYVRIKGDVVDASAREYPFEVMCKVYAYNPYVPKEKSLFEAIEDIAKGIWGKK